MFMRFVEPVIPVVKFPLGSQVRKMKTEMTAERVYRLVIYIGCSIASYLILKDSQYLQVYLGGELETPSYYENYPCMEEPPHLDDFYMICLSYHLFETVYTILYHYQRYDFSEHLLHHFVTIVLIGYSYILKKLPLGCVTMMVMDVSDIFVCLFKMTVDIHERLVFVTYVFMLIGWVYFRLFFFPIYVIKEHYL